METLPKLRLWHYWRSSASWRVRWAFRLKNISLEFCPVDLLLNESESPEHLARNPLGYVPVLEFIDRGFFLSQSMAMLQWAESVRPHPPLFDQDPLKKAIAFQLCETINADTAPLQNLSPQYMYSEDPEKRKTWAQHWIRQGLHAYQQLTQSHAGHFSMGNRVSAPDLFLIPQVYNARRYEIDLAEFPLLKLIFDSAMQTQECREAAPESFQP